jgi:hypothetical protein
MSCSGRIIHRNGRHLVKNFNKKKKMSCNRHQFDLFFNLNGHPPIILYHIFFEKSNFSSKKIVRRPLYARIYAIAAQVKNFNKLPMSCKLDFKLSSVQLIEILLS